MVKIGILTIGESPRKDLVDDIDSVFNKEVDFIQKGVLDNLNVNDIKGLSPSNKETILVSRLSNGNQVELSKEKILPLLQQKINDFHKENVEMVVLACTGKFEDFQLKLPVIYPDHLLSHVCQGLLKDNPPLHIVVPKKQQYASNLSKWNNTGFEVSISAYSPYEYDPDSFITFAKGLSENSSSYVVLDCIGYTQEMKEILHKYSSKTVILSREIVFLNCSALINNI